MVTFDFNKTPITQIADAIIIDASNRGASDIHLDPRENGIMTRIRVDGDLVDYAYIPKMYERNLTTRIKLMSNMNITESRLPQDGAIKGKFGNKELDMRVSCLPTNEGEKIVIRILDYTRSLAGLNKLGFNQENYQKLLRMIANPNGIILITGATGSGKSTTVYSILQTLNKEETNIITVEDPIEMNIEGMNQVQVNSDIGLDFATVLRSILRQDPNIILIGEIRDSETAQIAVRASITGHLVLSTIHTNNSLSTIERLLDMNVEKYLLSSAITGIISQRLAKMLCPHCKISRKTTPYEKKVFTLALKKDIETIYDANHDGCQYCHKGYRGRIAIQEVLEITDSIKAAINKSNSNKDVLRNLVYGSGNVITLLQDGLGKILNGLTTFEEIYRIIEIDNDIEDSCLTAMKEATSENKKEEENKKEQIQAQKIKEIEEKTNTNVTTGVVSTSALVNKNIEATNQSTDSNTKKAKQVTSIINKTPNIISNKDNIDNRQINNVTEDNKSSAYFPTRNINVLNNNQEPTPSKIDTKITDTIQNNNDNSKSNKFSTYFPTKDINNLSKNQEPTPSKIDNIQNNDNSKINKFSPYFPTKDINLLKQKMNPNKLEDNTNSKSNAENNKIIPSNSDFSAKYNNDSQQTQHKNIESFSNYFPNKNISTIKQNNETKETQNINNFFPTIDNNIKYTNSNQVSANINKTIPKTSIDNLIFPQGMQEVKPLTPITGNLINTLPTSTNNEKN